MLGFPTSTHAVSGTVAINSDLINVREGPGLSYKVVSKVKKGDQLKLLKEEGDWLYVQVSPGKTGWVANWLVTKNINPTITSGNSTNATVSTNGLRLRSGPGTSYSVVTTLTTGEQVTIFQTDGDWVKVDTKNGQGWVAREFLKIDASAQPSTKKNGTSTTQKGTILTDSLNVRSTPSTQGSIVGKLNKGDTIQIVSTQNQWIEIEYQGNKAWISEEYVQIESDDSNKVNNPIQEETTQPKKKNPSGIYGTVTANKINVRQSGSLNAKVIGTVSKGQSFKIVEEINSWAKVEIKSGTYGWIASWYLDKAYPKSASSKEQIQKSTITILHDGTNIRTGPNTNTTISKIASSGETFPVVSLKDQWYEIKLENGNSGYVAGWIVSVNGPAPQVEKPGASSYLKNKTIVIDPGHGGRDNGTTGVKGTIEKSLTLQTATLLYEKLKGTGAKVILTRNSDSYLSLNSRVSMSNYHNADAFISIHYDSIGDSSVKGMTSYYYHSYQKSLATHIHNQTVSQAKLNNRNVRFGDYYVLRENSRSSVLLELGYLSNPSEESLVTSSQYQERATEGIYQGLVTYFKELNNN